MFISFIVRSFAVRVFNHVHFIYCKKHTLNAYKHYYERAVENKHLHMNKNKKKHKGKIQNTLAMPKTRTQTFIIAI